MLDLKGEIDSSTYEKLDAALKPLLVPSTKAIVFDLNKVTYISSMGLSVIYRTKEELEKNKGTLLMTNFSPQVKKIFEMVKMIPGYLFASMEAADAYLDKFLSQVQKEDGAQ